MTQYRDQLINKVISNISTVVLAKISYSASKYFYQVAKIPLFMYILTIQIWSLPLLILIQFLALRVLEVSVYKDNLQGDVEEYLTFRIWDGSIKNQGTRYVQVRQW